MNMNKSVGERDICVLSACKILGWAEAEQAGFSPAQLRGCWQDGTGVGMLCWAKSRAASEECPTGVGPPSGP